MRNTRILSGPRRRTMALAVVGALLTAVLPAAGAPSPVSASPLVPALRIQHAAYVMIPAQPAPLVQVQLALRQGETRRLFGSVDAYSTTVTTATEMATWVDCVDAAHPTTPIGYHGEAAKNYVPGNTYLAPQTLFTAPATGTYTCSLSAYAENAGIYVIPEFTYLRWDGANVGPAGYWNSTPCGDPYPHPEWPACTYLGQPTDGTTGISQAYLLDATGTDPAQGWTAAPNATTVDASGTLGLTTCYKSRSCIPKYVTTRARGATVSTRMEVIQRNASGGVCNITSTDTFQETVSADVHHYGMPFTLFDVPVLTSCGSRVFSARIFVKLVSGDDFKIDGSLPDGGGSTGATRTHASIVNSTLTIPMPDVIGRNHEAATSTLQALGVSVLPQYIGAQDECTLAKAGQVVRSSPVAGNPLVLGGSVTLTICNPATTVVPDLFGWEETAALQALAGAFLFQDVVFVTDPHPSGTVVGQSIPGGQPALQYTLVTLTVSSGPAPTVVPPAGTWSEIFSPLITGANTLRVDVPGGTSSSGALLQLYRCHGYASNGGPERWQFVDVGPGLNGRAVFQIRNTGNNLCLMLANTSGTVGTKIAQVTCSSAMQGQWQILDQSTGDITNESPVQFELSNPWYRLCMAAANLSDASGTGLTTTGCTRGGTPYNTFELG